MSRAKARRRSTQAATEPLDLTTGRALAAVAAGGARSALAAVVLAHVRQPVGTVAAVAAVGTVAAVAVPARRRRARGDPRDVDVDPGDARDPRGPQAVGCGGNTDAHGRRRYQGDRTSSDDFHADLLVAGKDPPARTKGVLSQGCRPAGLFEGGTECSVLTGKSEGPPVSVRLPAPSGPEGPVSGVEAAGVTDRLRSLS